MNRVLIIAYYFPPSGGPGVQRVLKHVKYLPEFGWEPVVFTVANGHFPARDESLLEQIPKGIEVVRTKIYEPYAAYRSLTGKKANTAIDVNVIKKESQRRSFKEIIAELIRATFFIPDARMSWIFTSAKEAYECIGKYKIKAIYSSSPPYTCSVIARNLKRRTNLPWIAGFRDPWTDFLTSPKRWIIPAMIDRKLERSVFTEADSVEAAWEGIIKDALKKYPNIYHGKFNHIPNGFDSDDYPEIEPKVNDKFTITYTGSLYGRRNPQSLFEAIESLINSGNISARELHLRFVGRFGQEVEEMIEKTSFRDSIETVPYVPHEVSIRYLMESDAVLLIVDEAKESNEIVPGKVYEYLGVNKPIIAIAPEESAIASLLNETGCGKIAHQSNVKRISEILLEYYHSWKSGKSAFNPNLKAIGNYERRESARQLALLLDKHTK